MEKESVKKTIKEEAILLSDVAEILNISKRHVNKLIKQGDITPVTELRDGAIFIRSEIEEYKQTKERLLLAHKMPICGKSFVYKKLNHCKENISSCNDIESIFVYFYKNEAIMDGFFTVDEPAERNSVIRPVAPHMILRFKDGTETWYEYLNYGTDAPDPSEAYNIMLKLGVPSDLAEPVYEKQHLKLYRGEEWCVYEESDANTYLGKNWNDIQVCFYNKNKIFMQINQEESQDESAQLDYLLKNIQLIPNPIEVAVYSEKAAIVTGHYSGNTVYNIVVKDQSGHELWLSTPISQNIVLEKQNRVSRFLEAVGFPFSAARGPEFTSFLKSFKGTKLKQNSYLTFSRPVEK